MTSADSKEIHSWLRWRLRCKYTFKAYTNTSHTMYKYNYNIQLFEDISSKGPADEKKELAKVAV